MMAVEDPAPPSSLTSPAAAGAAAGTGSVTGSSGSSGTSGTSSGVLSDKVMRALQVRTDTVPMRAALEALSGVPSSLVDSRSVRTAIEMDALKQAQLLRQSLEERVRVVRDLRRQIQDVANAAQHVKEAVNTPVITAAATMSSTSAYATLPPTIADADHDHGTQDGASAAVAPPLSSSSSSSSTSSWLEREQQLAMQLSTAFEARNTAKARQEAVSSFLRHYHLSPEDQRLLEHYHFDDVGPPASAANPASAPTNGLAFLRALERLTEIRRELQRAHHRAGSSTPSSSGGFANASSRQGSTATSALRMMERIATQQEGGYERLYHWLQSYLTLAGSGSAAGAAGAPNAGTDDLGTDALEEALMLLPVGGGGGGSDESGDNDGGSSSPSRPSSSSSAAASSAAFVPRALRTLRNVPVFYAHLLELVAASRRTVVTRRFLTALTSGYQGMPPLELQSHDSTLYVGEMLGFCWRALCVETDIVRGLFASDGDGGGGGEPGDGDAAGNDGVDGVDDEEEPFRSSEQPMSASDLLSTAMSGLSRPLKSRIMQIITTLSRQAHAANGAANGVADSDNVSDDGLDEMEEEGMAQRHRIVHLYEICGLLLFYAGAVAKCLQKLPAAKETGTGSVAPTEAGAAPAPPGATTNPLLLCLYECLEEGTKGYEAAIRVYAARLAPLSSQSGESEARLVEALLHMLSAVRAQSPGFSAGVQYPSPETRHLLSLEWPADTLIRGALTCCQRLDHVVVLKQALALAKKAGMGDIVTVQRLDEAIDETEAALIEQVVDKEVTKVLDLCGLGTVMSSLAQWKDDGIGGDDPSDARLPMSSAPGLTPEDVESSIKDFYASLYSPPLPSLETTVKDPLLRRTARSKIAGRVADAYDDLYRHIMTAANEGGEYVDVVSVLGHSPDQVRTLLSV